MRKLALVLGSALLLLLALAAIGHARSPRAASSANAGPLGGINLVGLGVESTPQDADREIAAARSLHAKIVRVELPWPVLQPHGPGALDAHALAYADRLIDEASAHGIGVIALVEASPCWATSAPKRLRHSCQPGKGSAANGWPPTNPADFATLVKELATRYGDKLTAIEVWNEPDQSNEQYFAGPHKAQRYGELLRPAYTAIKQANPNIKVLAGSLVGSNGVFLRLLYAAGIKGYYDGLAVHFYTLTLAALRQFRSVQLANGDSAPLWLDEFGWSSCYPRRKIQEEQPCVTRSVQAQNITNLYRELRTSSYVAADTLYKLRDARTNQFGVLTTSGGHKPSFRALASVLVSPLGSPSRVRLTLRRSGAAVVASGSGPIGDFMRLEAFQHGALRYRATFTLDRFNRFSLRLPRVLGTSGLRVRVYQEWTGRGAGAQKSI
jgi:polysaccharide biosynthesis protein PslG